MSPKVNVLRKAFINSSLYKDFRSRRLYKDLRSRIYLLQCYYQLPIGSTILIHIGKCGGTSLKKGVKNAKWNSDIHICHVQKPIYRKDLKYIIVARNPISRLKSAFNWRYRVVVSEGTQRNMVKGEYDVLVKYGTLNNLAEALYYKDGKPNNIAQKEIRRIHHMREDIAFYLHELLSKCQPNQIQAVLMQENLNNDILSVFGFKNEIRANNNPVMEGNQLSEMGITNLMKFFSADYEALTKLYCWQKITKEVFLNAIKAK